MLVRPLRYRECNLRILSSKSRQLGGKKVTDSIVSIWSAARRSRATYFMPPEEPAQSQYPSSIFLHCKTKAPRPFLAFATCGSTFIGMLNLLATRLKVLDEKSQHSRYMDTRVYKSIKLSLRSLSTKSSSETNRSDQLLLKPRSKLGSSQSVVRMKRQHFVAQSCLIRIRNGFALLLYIYSYE